MTEPDWTSLLPPLLAIVLAIATRRVVSSLLGGIWLGQSLLLGTWNPLVGLAAALDAIVAVFAGAGDARVLLFMLLVGSAIAVMERGGGVGAFVALLERRRWVDGPARAQWLAWGTGLVIFIESTVTLLVAGALARPLFDRFRLARARLAYLIDATSAPVCMLIPANAWGALNLGLLENAGVDGAVGVLLAAIPLNFYALAAVVLAAISIRTGLALGPMRAADAAAAAATIEAATMGAAPAEGDALEAGRARVMVVPILALVLTVPVALWITGEGDFTAGSGSVAVLWAVLAALASAWLLSAREGVRGVELAEAATTGAGRMLPVTLLLLLAFTLGDVAGALGTGPYLAGLLGASLPAWLLPGVIFIVAAFTAFSIGSSFGTFALIVPLAMAVAEPLGLSAPLLLAAVLSGGVFGDHASPISHTTVVASLAAGVEHIEHVRTQLPYALLAGGFALACFLLAGLFS
ncbi:MAG: Na+/H+ antiporter NhaC family protein [Pseudomonadales bacterium]|jgi:Na+/H+ antiporter NhaC|nr:Na+/H+ antiporter NhaC family protein [Pseudomonadales bacterium]